MISIVQQRDLGRQIMSVGNRVGDKSEKDTDFREQMLLHNKLDGILPFDITMEDGEKKYEFRIGNKFTLEEYFRINSPSREKMISVLRQILEIIYRGREYMLVENDYIIGADTVFIDESLKIYLAYYPGYSQDLKAQLRELAQYFMEKVDYTDEGVVMLIYGFYMRTKETGCTFEDLLRSLGSASDVSNEPAYSRLTGEDHRDSRQDDDDYWENRWTFGKERGDGNETKQERDHCQENRQESGQENRQEKDKHKGFRGNDQAESGYIYSKQISKTNPDNLKAGSIENNSGEDTWYGADHFECGDKEKKRYAGTDEGERKWSELFGKTPKGKMTGRNDGELTEVFRTKEEGYIKPDPNRVFSESPVKLKLIGFLLPPAAVLILFILFRSGILQNAETGRNDVIKTGLALIMIVGGCFEAEKIMWKAFAKKLGRSLSSAEKEAEEATVFLYGNDTAGYPFSLVSDDQPPINVTHFPFFVGKDPQHCDYVMATQVGISRYHMKIDREGEDFTISDLNSTNGTFINGERLAPHLPHRIRRGDELRIGKCIYYCN